MAQGKLDETAIGKEFVTVDAEPAANQRGNLASGLDHAHGMMGGGNDNDGISSNSSPCAV